MSNGVLRKIYDNGSVLLGPEAEKFTHAYITYNGKRKEYTVKLISFVSLDARDG